MNLIKKNYALSLSCNESVTIYPYRSLNNISTRLEFQERCVKLALKTAYQTKDEFNFLFVASAHVDNESSSMSLIIEEFDKGQMKFGSNSRFLLPTAPLPDAIYIPSRLLYQVSLNQADLKGNEDLVAYYLNSIKFLANYFQKFCSTIDSISKIMSISSSIYYTSHQNGTTNNTNLLNASFDLITLANCFDASRIQPIPIIETSLLKTLQATSNFYLKPKTGYCALYKNENIILLMDSEPKANKLALIGIWVSGMSSLNHPLTWAACIRYAFSSLITNKSNELLKSFVVILFPSTSKRPEFYLCNPLQSSLEFTLLNGSSQFVTNKTNNENRYMTIDLTETKEGLNYKLFRNSLNQLFNSNSTTMQDIYGQHQMLFDFHQKLNIAEHLVSADLAENNISSINESLLSNSASFTSEKMAIKDTDLQPRSLNLLQSKLNDHKQDMINNSSSSSSSSTSSSTSSSSLSSYPINFLQQQQQQQQQLQSHQQLPLYNQFVKNKEISNSSSGIACVGSYHSVSDISVLSDNENDENVTSFFTNSLNASSGIHTMSTQSHFSNNTNNSNTQRSASNDFEFLRPKDPPPIPISKPNFLRMDPHQQITYNNNPNHYLFNSNVNSLSCSSGTSSLSPSPTPSLNNLSSSGMVGQQGSQPNLKMKLQQPPQTKSTDPFENSKSMMFGIPRDSPMPTYPAVHSISNLDSPFVDVTLNNCDDLSLYQPQPNVVVVGDSCCDMRKTILKKANECFPKENVNLISQHQQQQQKTELFKTNVKNPNESVNGFPPIFNNQMSLPSHTAKASTSSVNSNLMSSSSVNNFLVSSTPSSNIGLSSSSSSSSSSSISSSTPALMNKIISSNINLAYQQQSQSQQQQQNPSFLNSSVYSSISVSSNNTSSSNSSNHSSSNYSYTTPNQQHSVNLNSNNSFTNNEHLFEYNNSNQLKLKQSGSNQPSAANNYMEQLTTMHPQEIADLLMNKDEKLQSQLVEMSRLQETMNSLNLINKKQQILNNSTTPSSYNTTNNNSEIATIANSISQLAMQIEERKNIIKNNLFNSFNSQLPTPVNFKTHQHPQSQPQYSESNQQRSNANIFSSSSLNNSDLNYKPPQTELPPHFLASNQTNNRTINVNEPKDINLKSATNKNYADSQLNENNELQDEDKVVCENVFGAALKKKLDWQHHQQQQYDSSHGSNSVSLLNPVDTSMLLQKFNYVSLLLDDYCDKNTSMNTKALAYKYLNKNDVTLNTNNITLGINDISSMYTASSYFMNTPESNTTLISSTSTLPPFDLSKYEYNPNVPLFQYYTEANSVLLNPSSSFKASADNTSSNNGSLNMNQQNFENKAQFNGSLNPNFCIKTYATSSLEDTTGSSNTQVHKCTGEYKENKNSNQENKEDDADSESETTKRKNNLYQQHGNEDQDDDEDDGEIWLFGKPNSNSTKMPSDQKKTQKAKQKQRNQRQQRRENREKDFSDQDEPDRDVTTVLDIEKLKRLPKLL